MRTFDVECKMSPKNILTKKSYNSITDDINDTPATRSELKPVQEQLNKIKRLRTSITKNQNGCRRKTFSQTKVSIEQMNS